MNWIYIYTHTHVSIWFGCRGSRTSEADDVWRHWLLALLPSLVPKYKYWLRSQRKHLAQRAIVYGAREVFFFNINAGCEIRELIDAGYLCMFVCIGGERRIGSTQVKKNFINPTNASCNTFLLVKQVGTNMVLKTVSKQQKESRLLTEECKNQWVHRTLLAWGRIH